MAGNHVEDEFSEPVFFRYVMRFANGMERTFQVTLDPETLAFVPDQQIEPPDWTRLQVHQCEVCPFTPGDHPHCPVAVNLVDLIEFLKDLVSHEEVDVRVESRERSYFAHTTLQRVAGSLMGIYMVTSDCPILDKMRPMVETHLPFSTWQETVYRVMSMYLLAQYFRMVNGLAPNWNLHGLVDYYAQVQQVNVSFSDRLRAIPTLTGDASLNAVCMLASNATMASITIEEEDLAHWERIFMAHWGD